MFARHFPTLAAYPADKWLMIPLAFFITIGVLMGLVLPFFEVPKYCDPCHDVMMKRLDAYTCTAGRTDHLPDAQLAACRRKLGKPEIY